MRITKTGQLLSIAALATIACSPTVSQEELDQLQREIAALNIAEEELKLRKAQDLYGTTSSPALASAPLAPSVPVLEPALQGNTTSAV